MDRNSRYCWHWPGILVSLSARRAWIEIDIEGKLDADLLVALRKESVDRNTNFARQVCLVCRSLSARRAWIEMGA